MTKRLLGEGKSLQYEHLLNPNEICLEEGKKVYAVDSRYFCIVCDGTGCKRCNWTGEEDKANIKRNSQVYPGTERKWKRGDK